MTRKVEKTHKAKTLDDGALDNTAGGASTRTYTGGRFMLDISGHNVGLISPPIASPPPKS